MIFKIAATLLLLVSTPQVLAASAVGQSGTTEAEAEAEASNWIIEGNNSVNASEQLLARMRGESGSSDNEQKVVTILWPEAQLTSTGRPPMRVRLELTLTAGTTMSIGPNTPYPGLITKLTDAQGSLTNLSTGYRAELVLSERESWIGKFIHSSSAGIDHLAVEVPFSLYDVKTQRLIAESNLLVRFDLTDMTAPKARRVLLSPTPTADLHFQTSDIGKAMKGGRDFYREPMLSRLEVYDAAVTHSKATGVAGRSQFADLFSLESLDLYQCDTGEWMALELDSPGFTREGRSSTGPFKLRLRYMPTLIDAEGQVAYLDQLAGVLTFDHDGRSVNLLVGPGNHAKVASRAYQQGSKIKLDLGVAFREGSGRPTLGHLVVTCRTADSTCETIRLSTAANAMGRAASNNELSAQIENTSFRARAGDPIVLGGPTPCPGICPVCRTDGCIQGVGMCAEAGAPIGCSAGCPHSGGASQCCRGGTGRMCCVQRCGVPDH